MSSITKESLNLQKDSLQDVFIYNSHLSIGLHILNVFDRGYRQQKNPSSIKKILLWIKILFW